jgi:hypothetical protein
MLYSSWVDAVQHALAVVVLFALVQTVGFGCLLLFIRAIS